MTKLELIRDIENNYKNGISVERSLDAVDKYSSALLRQTDVVRSLPLVEALEQYIGVLGEELDELASVAIARGWKSSRVEVGEQLRNRIAELKRQ